MVLALVTKPTTISHLQNIHALLSKVLVEFDDVFPTDLPNGLPLYVISSTVLIFFQTLPFQTDLTTV